MQDILPVRIIGHLLVEDDLGRGFHVSVLEGLAVERRQCRVKVRHTRIAKVLEDSDRFVVGQVGLLAIDGELEATHQSAHGAEHRY